MGENEPFAKTAEIQLTNRFETRYNADMPKRRVASPSQSVRLVKTWLPVSLVKEMDETILRSGGAYNGRDDFIREAIADRISEDRLRPGTGGPAPVILLRAGANRTGPPRPDNREQPKEDGSAFLELSVDPGDLTRTPTLPPRALKGALYGLHNRDYPTLWAAHSSVKMATSRGAPVPWPEFLSEILEAAWRIGAQLARADEERNSIEMKASIGFPTNPEKRQSAEGRFVEHMLGMPSREGSPTGPLFAMQLAGTAPSQSGYVIAPTERGKELLKALAAAGLAARPPHSADAWRLFRRHLCEALPEDYSAWTAVLRALAEMPTREDIVRRFSDNWPGAAASTNVAGYVSRGREWGLIAPKLTDGRYELTALGQREIEERNV